MVDPLTRLAIFYGTDKIGYHDYTPNYFSLFKHLSDAPVRLLEIGVGGYQDADRGGESLEVWRDFFPNGSIVGIDIQKKEMDLGERVSILQGSQVDADFLSRVVQEHGPFDIIIDDGSHQNEHVVTSFGLLFPTMAPGGIYVVEDTQTSFFPRFGGSLNRSAPNSVGYFHDIFTSAKSASSRSTPLGQVAGLKRFHNMVAVFNAANDSDPTPDDVVLGQIKNAGNTMVVGKSSVIEALQKKLPDAQIAALPTRGRVPSMQTITTALKDHGPFDLVVDASAMAAEKIATRIFPALETGADYLKCDPDKHDMTWLGRLFVDVDHREIAVHFPEYQANPLSKNTYSIEKRAGSVTLGKAPNDYPSNFGFDFEHPQAKRAINQMEQVLDVEGRERGMLLFADIVTRAGQEDRAARMLKKLGKTNASSRAYFNLAVRRAKLDQDWDQAMDLLTRAVDLYPGDYRIRSQLGGVHSKARNWDDAAREFTAGIELAPRDPLLRIQMANTLSRLGRADDAVLSARVAVDRLPQHAGHRVQLGRLEIMAGDFDAAIATLQHAISLDAEMPTAHRQLSRAYQSVGRLSEALTSAENAITLRPDNTEFGRWRDRLNTAATTAATTAAKTTPDVSAQAQTFAS